MGQIIGIIITLVMVGILAIQFIALANRRKSESKESI